MSMIWRNILTCSLIGIFLLLIVSTSQAKSSLPVQEISQIFTKNSLFNNQGIDVLDYLSSAKNLDELRSYLLELDKYATYTMKTDREDLAKVIRQKPASIGMDIFRDRFDRVLCVPYPSSQAAAMGIHYADVLQIDEQRVDNLTIEEIASLIRGEANTEVALLIKTAKQDPRWVYPVRVESGGVAPTVLFYHQKRRPIIWILRFGPDTPTELARCLEQFPAEENLIIDLCGNTGGNLAAAISCAKMFLGSGDIVAKINTKHGLKIVRAEKNGLYTGRPIILRQDRYTASAAEMFITALVHNHCAESEGEKSAGKSLVQTLFWLKGGGILKISTEKLLNLNDANDWEGRGLLPNRFANLRH